MTFSSAPRVVVVGTAHRLQAGHTDYSPKEQASFGAFLDRLIVEYSVEYVAEEMVATLLLDYGVIETLVRTAALRNGKRHAYIDLEEGFRSGLNIDRMSVHDIGQAAELSGAQFAAFKQLTEELREYVWLVRLLKENTWPALFVCGARHASRVQLLLNSVGVLSVLEDYEPEVKQVRQRGRPR